MLKYPPKNSQLKFQLLLSYERRQTNRWSSTS